MRKLWRESTYVLALTVVAILVANAISENNWPVSVMTGAIIVPMVLGLIMPTALAAFGAHFGLVSIYLSNNEGEWWGVLGGSTLVASSFFMAMNAAGWRRPHWWTAPGPMEGPLWARSICAMPLGIGTIFGGLLILAGVGRKTAIV